MTHAHRAFAYASLVVALSACSIFHRSTPSAPSVSELAERYKCSEKAIEANRKTHWMEPVKQGTPACDAIGRYGEPVGITTQHTAGMQLVSLLHSTEGRYVSVTLVGYDDTPANRKLKRPIGTWMVDTYKSSQAVASPKQATPKKKP
jgi:hypothetical protein